MTTILMHLVLENCVSFIKEKEAGYMHYIYIKNVF